MRFLVLLGLLMLTMASVDAAPGSWKLTPVSSNQKLTASKPGILDPFKTEPVQLQARRGEWVNFQFVVTATERRIDELKITVNGLASPSGYLLAPKNLEIYRENFVYVAHPSGNRVLTPKWWPDALIPVDLAGKSVEGGQSAVYWASLKIPNETIAGDYYGELDFEADGQPRRLAVILSVEDKVQPAPRFRGTVALYYDVLRDWYAKDGHLYSDEEWLAQKKRFYEFLLGYHINAYDLPVAWNSPEVESYLRDPRVLSVRTPPLTSPDFPLALEKFKATGTLGKAFYYWIDEPQSKEQFAQVCEATKKLRELGIAHLVTAHPNAALEDAVDIWCPNIGDFFGVGHLDAKQLAAERKAGRQTWFYTMVEPRYPHPTWLLDDDAASIHAYGSLVAKYGFTGFVYSMCHGWGPKPLEKLESFEGSNGDGTLLYPAEQVGGAGPMPSIRLMLLRDVLEEADRDSGAANSPETPVHRPVALSSLILHRDGVSDTKVSWRFDRSKRHLVVNFKALGPQVGDYVAVELAPLELLDGKDPERWRYIATLKGALIVEKWTREGHFRFEDKGFKVSAQQAAGVWNVEMRVPLDAVGEDDLDAPILFDVMRRTTAGGAKVATYAFSGTGDPYLMAQIRPNREKVVRKIAPNRAKAGSRAKIPGAQTGH